MRWAKLLAQAVTKGGKALAQAMTRLANVPIFIPGAAGGAGGFVRAGKLVSSVSAKVHRSRLLKALERAGFKREIGESTHHVVDTLRDMLDAHGELLPLEDEGGVELFLYNPRALDAFDHETVGSRDDNGRVQTVNCHVLIPSVVKGVDLFKQAYTRAGNIYLSDRFVQRWKQAKLKGLDFILAWDSDLPPDQQPNVWTSKPIK